MDFFRNRVKALTSVLLVLLVTSLPALAQNKITVAGLKQLIDQKQAAQAGKGLSTYDLTASYKARLDSFYLYLGRYAPLTHNHTFAQVPNLQSALNAKVDTGALPRVYFGTGFAGSGITTDKYRIANSGVTAGTYGSASKYAGFTVGLDGRVISVTEYSFPTGGTASNVPTAVSAFTNDAGYQKATDVNTAIAGKVDKVTGKDLSSNDYTTAEKTKLAGLSTPTLAGLGGITTAQATAISRQVASDSTASIEQGPGISVSVSADKKKITVGSTPDQSYNAASTNAQSGVAVAQLGAQKANTTHTHSYTQVSDFTAGVIAALKSFSGYTSSGSITITFNNGSPLLIPTPTGSSTATAPATTQLATPSPLSLTATSSTNVAASWPAVANATGYILQRSSASDFSNATVSYNGPNTSVPGSNTLTASTTYYYRVQAITTASGFTSSDYATASVTTPAASTTATSSAGLMTGNPFSNWNLTANSQNAAGITNTNSVTATADSYIVGNARSVSGATESIIQMDCVDGTGTGDLAFGKGTGWAGGNAMTISISKGNTNKIFVRSGTAYLQQPVIAGVTALRLRKVPRTDGTAGDRIYAEYYKAGAWVTLDSSVTTTADEYVKATLGAAVSLTNVQASGLTN